jgi:hypothetical protein
MQVTVRFRKLPWFIQTQPNQVMEPVESLDEPEAVPGVSELVVLTLVSLDGGRFQVTAQEGGISGLIRKAMEVQPDVRELQIALTSDVLELVTEYMRYHKGKEASPPARPLASKRMSDVCEDPWDAAFIDRAVYPARRRLYSLIAAANYMDIYTLLHLAAAKTVSLIKGVPLERLGAALDPETC